MKRLKPDRKVCLAQCRHSGHMVSSKGGKVLCCMLNFGDGSNKAIVMSRKTFEVALNCPFRLDHVVK